MLSSCEGCMGEKGKVRGRMVIHVLFVDDDQLMLDLTREFLEQQEEGFGVDTAISAGEALRKLSKEKYDVVVSDYKMPEMNGLEFLSELRGRGNQIPFIMFTGKGREEVAVEAFMRGADGYVMKGGDPTAQYAELVNWIKAAVARRKAQNSLRESEERLRSIIETMGIGLGIYDKNNIRTYVNPTFAGMMGYKPEEMIGKPPSIHKDSLEKYNAELEKRRRGESSNYEVEVVTRKGETIPVQIVATPILDENKEFAGSHSLIIDITERRRIEEALRESEEKYRELVETSNDGIMIVTKDFEITFANQSIHDLLGYGKGGLVGTDYLSLIPGSEHEDVLQRRKRRQKIGERSIHERTMVKKEGAEITVLVSASPYYDEKGKYAGALAFFTDITERKRMEETLQESEERYRTLVELAHDGIMLTEGPKRTIRFTNYRMAEMLGYGVEELVGKSYMDLLDPDYVKQYLQDRESFFKLGRPSTFETRFITKDGSTLHTITSVSLVNLKDKSEEAPLVCVFTDITERKRLEDRERYLHSLLRHDLGNKMQGAYGYLELLRRVELPDRSKKYVEGLQQSLQGAVELIDEVRELRMIDEARETVDVDLDLTIRDAIEDTSTDAGGKGIAISYRGTPSTIVKASPLLKNAFVNLIDNSIRHADCRKITVTVRELRDKYQITVKDDGKGIPETVGEKLFKRGAKGTGSTGSGLGLHLTKRIIDASHGSIQLRNTKKGTRFDIYLKKTDSGQRG